MNKALVVDDSLMMREVFSSYLHKAGFNNIKKASSVEEAQNVLKNYCPNLIVLDVVMGGQSGFEFCHQLKKDRKTCEIAIVICSTKTTQADFLLGDIIGADAYLPKTVEPTEFISKVKQLTQKPAFCRLLE